MQEIPILVQWMPVSILRPRNVSHLTLCLRATYESSGGNMCLSKRSEKIPVKAGNLTTYLIKTCPKLKQWYCEMPHSLSTRMGRLTKFNSSTAHVIRWHLSRMSDPSNDHMLFLFRLVTRSFPDQLFHPMMKLKQPPIMSGESAFASEDGVPTTLQTTINVVSQPFMHTIYDTHTGTCIILRRFKLKAHRINGKIDEERKRSAQSKSTSTWQLLCQNLWFSIPRES